MSPRLSKGLLEAGDLDADTGEPAQATTMTYLFSSQWGNLVVWYNQSAGDVAWKGSFHRAPDWSMVRAWVCKVAEEIESVFSVSFVGSGLPFEDRVIAHLRARTPPT